MHNVMFIPCLSSEHQAQVQARRAASPDLHLGPVPMQDLCMCAYVLVWISDTHLGLSKAPLPHRALEFPPLV